MSELKIAAIIPLTKGADWVAITPDGVWVGSKKPFAVNEIDPQTNAVTTVALPGNPCAGLAVDSDSLWVPLCGPVSKLAQVDLKTRTLIQVLDIGPAAPEGGIAIGAGSIWLVTDKSGSMARIDPTTGKTTQIIALPPGSYNPVFRDGRVWVTRVEGAEVTVVDANTGLILDHVAVGNRPRFVTSSPDAVWTLNQADGTVSRIGIAGHHDVVSVPLGIPGTGGDITYGDGRVWTTLMKTPLSVVDASTSAILCQWKGDGGDSLAVGHGAVWLTDLTAGTVSRIALQDLPDDCSAKTPQP
jgi:streptogramin lyase